jgi:hypothetical protein
MKTIKTSVKKSSKFPVIKFEQNGNLSISGNSISIKPEVNYNPLINWIGTYKGDSLRMEIDLDMVNCRSVKMLYQAIVTADLNNNIKKKYINWFYRDEEQQELGEMISSMLTSSKFQLTYRE